MIHNLSTLILHGFYFSVCIKEKKIVTIFHNISMLKVFRFYFSVYYIEKK